jgi:hypothetical protein
MAYLNPQLQKRIDEYVKQFGYCNEKFIPKEIFNCSKKQLNILLTWLIKGDGNIHKKSGTPYYWTTSKKLKEKGHELSSSEITLVPNATIAVSGDDARKLLKLVETLEEHDDVQNVYSNFDIPDEIMAEHK